MNLGRLCVFPLCIHPKGVFLNLCSSSTREITIFGNKMSIKKLESVGGIGGRKPQANDNITIAYVISEYAPTRQQGRDCKGRQ